MNVDIEKLNTIVRGALFTEVRELSDGRSIVMDPETEELYYRKRLSVYSVPVFRFLKEHTHKNLPKILMFWQEEGDLIVIEELIQGKTLEQYLDPEVNSVQDKEDKHTDENASLNQPDFEEKKRILLEICDGLSFLHHAAPPIIHRDIKASNIMIRGDGSVKIIDYDAAKQYIADKKRDTVLIGTQGIAAPEQYGFAQSDERTDIFALGKLVERLLPESKYAQEIAEKATKLQPELRYETVEQMRRQIERLWDPAFSAAEHRKQVVREKLRSRTGKRLMVGIGIASILLICGIVFRVFLYPELFVRKPAYEKAIELMETEDYLEAKQQFEICGADYKDVADRLKTCEEKLKEEQERERIEQIRGQYETAAEEAMEKWRGAHNTTNETKALIACKQILLQGIDDGESVRACCEELYQEALVQFDSKRIVASRDILLTMEEQLTETDVLVAVMNEKRDEYVTYLQNNGGYGEIAKYYEKLSEIDHQERSSKIREAKYNEALDLKNSGSYESAAQVFLTIIEYKDSAEQKKECCYLAGTQYISQGKIKVGLEQLAKAEDYADAKELIGKAKYQYCKDHVEQPDDTTRKFLAELEKAGYPGVKELKKQVEMWKLDFTPEVVNAYQVNLHVTFYGGPEEGMTGYKAVLHEKNGFTSSHVSSTAIRSGYTDTLRIKNPNGNIPKNLKRMDIYDNSGNLIGSYSW